MNKLIKEILSTRCTYIGDDIRASNGDIITQWKLPDGQIVEIIVLEGDDMETINLIKEN